MTWDEAFARRYEWSAHLTEDVAFYIDLAREAEGPLVELAVGTGRVAIPIAQATGRSVIGIDSSPAMLEQARARAAERGVELDLREGDMRELTLDEQAALKHQDEPLPHTIRYAVGDNRIDITLDDGATSSLWWQRRTNGSVSSTSPGSSSRLSSAASAKSHWTTTAANTCSWPAAGCPVRALAPSDASSRAARTSA